MIKYVFLLLSAFILIPALYAQHITVATYNIRNENNGDASEGNGWEQRCPVITRLICFHDFDIFGAQEVLYEQLNDMLSQLKGYNYIGIGRDDGQKEGEFSPVFYKKDKFLLMQSGTFWLSETDDRPSVGWDAALPRICTWGKFQIKESGTCFWFFNLHMDHIGEKARLESSRLIIQKIKMVCAGEPVILTGDFNVDQTSEAYKLVTGSGMLFDSYETTEIRYALNGTFNNFKSNLKTDSRIDHIFVSKGFQVLRYGVLTDSYRTGNKKNTDEIKSSQSPDEYIIRLPSDHYPVMVGVKFAD